MKLAVILFSFFLSSNSFGQLTTNVTWTKQSSMPASGVIYYDLNENLVWEDFSGKPPTDNSIVAALTVSGFGYDANIKTIDGKGQLNIRLYCYFSKNKSWVKPGKNTAYILTHEQHHFDISYIAAAIFMHKLQSARFTTANYNVQLSRIYNECCDIMNKTQDNYDGQTKNGQLKDEQARWNSLITAKIRSATD